MDDYHPADRPYPSPATQRRTGEIWKARLGLGFVSALTLVSAAVMFRLAGLGIGAAVSPFQSAAPTSTTVGLARGTVLASSASLTATPGPGATFAPAGASPSPSPNRTLVPGQSTTPVPGQSNPITPQVTGTPMRSPTATLVTVATREHAVASGDTLGAIAVRYGTTVDTIVRLNDYKDRNQTLNIGQKVKVP